MTSDTSFFAHEQNAIDEIKRYFAHKTSFRVLSNLLIHDPQSNYYYEYDLIIIARTNIYVVELKHWSGRIEVASYNWRINESNYRRDPHTSNIYKSKVLRGWYQRSFPTYPSLWVESVVVLTHPDAIVEGADSPRIAVEREKRNPTFSSISDFISYVNSRSSRDELTVLEEHQVRAVADRLERLAKPRSSVPTVLLGYEIVETVSATPERIELLGRHAQGQIKGLKRFRVFRAPAGYSGKDKERFLRQAYNAGKSVTKIGDHPNILQVQVVNDEAAGVVEVSDWSDVGTLRDYMEGIGEKPNKDKALSICQGILSALRRAHEVDVIHRAVKPENILMVNDRPKLMNFELAYIVEDDRLTVIEDPSSLRDDGYIAPEILFGDDIDETTDYFGLAVIAYELFTGERPFETVRQYMARGGRLTGEHVVRLRQAGLSTVLVDVIVGLMVGERAKRLHDVDIILDAFGYRGSGEVTGVLMDTLFAPGTTHDIYEIEEFVAEGREAHVYRGKTLDSKTLDTRTVALKIYKLDVPNERARRELSALSRIESSYVVRPQYFGHWRNERYFLVMDYIEGETMRSLIEKGERPNDDEFRSVALCLMEAVSAFHNCRDDDGNLSPLLHCDIKPDNIIITKDKKPVLFDCTLAGESRVEAFQGTRDYVPPDSVLGSDVQLTQTSDLYALGVTLWEWLLGQKPYSMASVGATPKIPVEFDTLPEHLRAWLLKAVATEEERRFKNIDDMRKAFTQSKTDEGHVEESDDDDEAFSPPETPEQDVYVAYLNTLANHSGGNENATAEHQMLSGQFQKIHVNNPITDTIYERLTRDRTNVVLTGNAGDGKTTIAIDIFRKLESAVRPLQPIERVHSAGLVIIKDMSELSREEQEKVLTEARDSTDFVYLIVSNTGTFLEGFKRVFQGDNAESTLLNALKADSPQSIFDDRFFVINLGRIDSIATACKVLRRMVDERNWAKCLQCNDPWSCPLYINVQLIRERQDVFFERLELLYRRLFEYGNRLTMRHMTGHLAYALTGGLQCRQVRRTHPLDSQNSLHKQLFFNRFFGDDGARPVDDALQLYAIRKVQEVGLGTVPDSKFERHQWLKEVSTPSEKDRAHRLVWDLITRENSTLNRRQVRRYAFFFESFATEADRDRFISIFLRSEFLTEYVKYSRRRKELTPLVQSVFKRQIIQVLQEFFTGLRFPEGGYKENYIYITLNRDSSASNVQLVLADFKVDDFKLTVKPKYEVGDDYSGVLALQYDRKHDRGKAELELDLPFLDYVARRYRGEIAEELSAFYADRLERFKVALLTLYEQEQAYQSEKELRLLVIRKGRRFELKRLLLHDGKLEVL